MEYSKELHDYLREGQNPSERGYEISSVVECLLDEVERLNNGISDLITTMQFSYSGVLQCLPITGEEVITELKRLLEASDEN